jgi:serine/threonine-protein kinase
MLTGKRAFEGESQASLISSIMNDVPVSVSTLKASTPSSMDFVVRTCLAKERDERWQNTGDVGRQLRWLATDSATTKAPDGEARSRNASWLKPTVVALAAIAVVVATFLFSSSSAPPVPVHFDIALRDGQRLSMNGMETPVAISRDGKQLVYVGGDTRRLYLRSFDSFDVRALNGTEGASYILESRQRAASRRI